MMATTCTAAIARRALHLRNSRPTPALLQLHPTRSSTAATDCVNYVDGSRRRSVCTDDASHAHAMLPIPIIPRNHHQHHHPCFNTRIAGSLNTPNRQFERYFSSQSESVGASSSSSSSTRRRHNTNSNQTDKPSSSSLQPSLQPLTAEQYDPSNAAEQIYQCSFFNQGKRFGQQDSNVKQYKVRRYSERKWDYKTVRAALENYERHLQFVFDHLNAQKEKHNKQKNDNGNKNEEGGKSSSSSSVTNINDMIATISPNPTKCTSTHRLLSSRTLSNAIRALTRSKLDTPLLSQRIRDIERLVGQIGWTPITEELSYRLLEANGKGGNVRRTLALLELRRRRGYKARENEEMNAKTFQKRGGADDDGAKSEGVMIFAPGEKEFIHAITSIQSAQLPLRRSRNIYLHESTLSESSLDNPTRYLDAILLNMAQRNVPLRPSVAARMLACYASTGRTGRGLHYFYKVMRDPIEEDGYYIPGPHPTHLGREELKGWKDEKRRMGAGRYLSLFTNEDKEEEGDKDEQSTDGVAENAIASIDDDNDDASLEGNEKKKVRMILHPPPPFQKIPSAVKDKSISFETALSRNPIPYKPPINIEKDHRGSSSSSQNDKNKPRTMKSKYEWELEREWSLSLTAAFAFADSLTHGACGHDPIELDVASWNSLIKACCYRGAFHRALKIINETMPQRGIEPDTYSYNTLLAGLARVGDINYLKEYLMSMTNKTNQLSIDKYTVQAMADGFLNVGDISGASSMVQDIFNQHNTLPPYTTHLKIIEFALSNGLIFEAKRHVYFIQQLWKWEPMKHHEEEFVEMVMLYKRNPKLSKEALQRLFRHFHEDLHDEDFF